MAKVPLIPARIRPWEGPKESRRVGDDEYAAAGVLRAEGIYQVALDPDDEDVDDNAEALADLWNGKLIPLEEVKRQFELEARARKQKKAMAKASRRAGASTSDATGSAEGAPTTSELEWGYRPRLGEGLRPRSP